VWVIIELIFWEDTEKATTEICYNKNKIITSPQEGCEVLWWVCLSVCSHNSKTAGPNFTIFWICCLWPWLSSDYVTIRCVLPVLWMTSCFHTMGPIGQNRARRYVQKSSPCGGTSRTSYNYSVWLSSSECGTGDEVCFYDCLGFECTYFIFYQFGPSISHSLGWSYTSVAWPIPFNGCLSLELSREVILSYLRQYSRRPTET